MYFCISCDYFHGPNDSLWVVFLSSLVLSGSYALRSSFDLHPGENTQTHICASYFFMLLIFLHIFTHSQAFGYDLHLGGFYTYIFNQVSLLYSKLKPTDKGTYASECNTDFSQAPSREQTPPLSSTRPFNVLKYNLFKY